MLTYHFIRHKWYIISHHQDTCTQIFFTKKCFLSTPCITSFLWLPQIHAQPLLLLSPQCMRAVLPRALFVLSDRALSLLTSITFIPLWIASTRLSPNNQVCSGDPPVIITIYTIIFTQETFIAVLLSVVLSDYSLYRVCECMRGV